MNSVTLIMADIVSLIDVLIRQHEEQMDEQARQYREQMDEQAKQHNQQMDKMKDEVKNLMEAARDGARRSSTPMTSFSSFDSSSELWLDSLERFRTFLTANSIPKEGEAQVFLTNQSIETYKLLSNLAAQQSTLKTINKLKMDDN